MHLFNRICVLTQASRIEAAFGVLSLNTFFSTASAQEIEQCRDHCRGHEKESIAVAGQ
jgi:hypothetical protein